MDKKVVNLVVKYSNQEEFWVEICSKLENALLNNDRHVKKVEKDCKSNELLKLKCDNCHESIELNLYFYNSKLDIDSKTVSNLEVKHEPEVFIKQEEKEIENNEEVDGDDDDEDDNDYEQEKDESSDTENEVEEEVEAENNEEFFDAKGQKMYRRKYGNQPEIVTNFDFRTEICDICDYKKKKYASFSLFLIHRAQHFIKKVSDKEYHCIACGDKFPKIDAIRVHTRTCPKRESLIEKHKTGKIKIKIATNVVRVNIPEGIVLPDLKKLKPPYYMCIDQPDGSKIWIEKTKSLKGVRISNFDSRVLKCDLCGFEAKHRSMQIRHRKLHLFQQEGDQKCLGCHKIFPNADDRIAHAYCCPKKDTVNILACSYCNFMASSYLNLRNHIGSTHGKNKESYGGANFIMCYICSKEVRRCKMHGHLLKHSVADGKPYTCAHCEKRFSSRGALKSHLVKFHFKNFANYSCHLCPLVFKGRQEYDKHLFSRHRIGKSNAVPCSICGQILANESSLNSHMNSRHKDASQKQKFECPHCEKFFFKKTNLEIHIPTHLPESERPFKCFCGRGFCSRDKLNRHKLEHTDPNKLLSVCNVCGKSMKSKQSLKVHMRIHTGEQPYECNFCKKRFADRGNYRVHMKQHERELGLKLTFTTEERRLMKLNVLKPDQMLENPGRSGLEEINQAK